MRFALHATFHDVPTRVVPDGIGKISGPLDLIKAQSVPGTQAKELFMPVGQISGQLRPNAALSLAAYYQYDWRKSRLPAAGSYLSSTDVLDAGGERLLSPSGPALPRGADFTARDRGQWGMSARYSATELDTEFGVYYLRFNEKLPQLYLRPGAGDYVLAYPEDIRVLGASFSTVVGDTNVAGEIHVRRNMPLASVPLIVPAGTSADNRDRPLYAVGNTVHVQVSVIHVVKSTPWWDSGTVSAEVGALYRTSITRNAANIDPARERGALGLTLNFTPSYFQVLPNLDVSVPLSLSYNVKGKSPVASAFNGDKAGTFSIGINTEYERTWNANLRYAVYFGGTAVQPLSDRDFISLSIQRTF